jgi:hypothetical protein
MGSGTPPRVLAEPTGTEERSGRVAEAFTVVLGVGGAAVGAMDVGFVAAAGCGGGVGEVCAANQIRVTPRPASIAATTRPAAPLPERFGDMVDSLSAKLAIST